MKKLNKVKRRLRPLAKPKAKRKVQRNPYARALETATRRHDKALLDYRKYLVKLDQLGAELPRLEQMKLALEDYLKKGSVGPMPDLVATSAVNTNNPDAVEARVILNQPLTPRIPSGPIPGGFVIPAHLQHMIKEHPLVAKGGRVQGGVTHIELPSTGPDDMLPDLGPGDELIPDHQVIITES